MLELKIMYLEKGKADFSPQFLAFNNIKKFQPDNILPKN